MQFPKSIEISSVQEIQPGCFYWIQTSGTSYRINEPENFQKKWNRSLIAFLDQQESLHHFNRLQSQSAAITTLEELLSDRELEEVQFSKIDDESVSSLAVESSLQDSVEDLQMLVKTIKAFQSQKIQESNSIEIKTLKEKYMKEYIYSLEMAR